MLSKESQQQVKDAVKAAGDYLQPRLKPLPSHPTRNAYAHVWRALKETIGGDYKLCDDEDVPVLLDIIEGVKNES